MAGQLDLSKEWGVPLFLLDSSGGGKQGLKVPHKSVAMGDTLVFTCLLGKDAAPPS